MAGRERGRASGARFSTPLIHYDAQPATPFDRGRHTGRAGLAHM